MGPQNAGKTTLLGAWYLLLGRGAIPDDLRFSGSCSLAGWEAVASSLRWEPGSIRPSFPPHTSSRSTRVPGLLHLAFKRGVDHRRDYVMTDAPGEWFRNWAVNRDAPAAEGARWAAEHADVFLLVADREALAGPEKGAARTDIQLLARRLADDLRGRPVALVWTKADTPIPEDTEEAVRSAVLRAVPRATEFAVSIMSESDGTGTGQGLVDLLRWVLYARRPALRLPEPAGDNLDPLFIFGVR
ncbi:TRAFAC clade GTPase domain-containing protein [Candidatus Palauibacter sp.]|uniref:TRAFAC clade GTPase domain-containing protein n=1 Tax=Candidatus Palauibacter sp. TaxID=3101350 RepID=UPI003B52CA93